MGSWQCNKSLEAKSSRDIQRLAIAGLDYAYQPLVVPLHERHLKRAPEEGSAQRPVGGDMEHAALVLMVVVSHRCNYLTILGFCDPAEVFNPD